MNIPYGTADFPTIREGRFFYVDKTGFIPMLEDPQRGRRYVLFLRPRRFGKSTFLSTLDCYYDVARKERFAELFGDLYIGRHPTAERSRYLVLRLEFSGLSTEEGVAPLRAAFYEKLESQLAKFFTRYAALLPEQAADWRRRPALPSREPASLFLSFLTVIESTPYKLYLLIDEYDRFANDLIARGSHDTYRNVIQASGFVRRLFEEMKAGADLGVVRRMFMTGVSPIMVNDMTSGFNILNFIFLDDDFHDLCGFREADVAGLLDDVIASRGLRLDRDQVLSDLRRYYNGYRFSTEPGERLYNPDMILYFMSRLRAPDQYPREILDPNVRIDLSRLHAVLFAPDGTPRPGPLAQIRSLLLDRAIPAELYELFRLDQAYEEKYFASYLYYLGLLTVQGQHENRTVLRIPNLVIDQLYGEALNYILGRTAEVQVDQDRVAAAVAAMAFQGDIEPLLRLLQEQVIDKLSNRDLIRMDERALKMLVLAYVSLGDVFYPASEQELNHGYGDLVLLLDRRRYPTARFSYLIELKYLKALPQRKGAGVPKAVEAALGEAEEQLRCYLADGRLAGQPEGWKAVSVVQVGTAALYFREPGQETRSVASKARGRRGRK